MPMLFVDGIEYTVLKAPYRCPLRRGDITDTVVDNNIVEGKRMTLGCRRQYSTDAVLRYVPQPEESDIDTSPPPSHVEAVGQAADGNKLVLWRGEDGSEVVVDPALSAVLRDHQRQGVQFVFNCLMGLIDDFEGEGCILADDMGLGKTLQSVTIVWTLLTSLVKNWEAEFNKWLGSKVKVCAVAESQRDKVIGAFTGFRYNREMRVLIASYETFRNHCDLLAECPIGLVVCDEAHRLKNDRTKTSACIGGLRTRKRLLLSGTPIQNDLDEFFAMITLANPCLAEEKGRNSFRKRFANPISCGREPDATDEEKALADERLAELSEMSNKFILRRTNVLLAKVLPPKHIVVAFVRLSSIQTKLYKAFITSDCVKATVAKSASRGKVGKNVLSLIQSLTKLCNHPSLIRRFDKRCEKGFEATHATFDELDQLTRAAREATGARGDKIVVSASAKFSLVYNILNELRKGCGLQCDRVVIISNYTQTIDILQKMCQEEKWPVIRLDGSIGVKKRHTLVSTFNDPKADAFVFLLSSKAGGNRLIMFDPDWNPANDRQAMARIWRDGQTKVCWIYRLLSTGTIEEKIFQRQMKKDSLSDIVVQDDSAKDDYTSTIALPKASPTSSTKNNTSTDTEKKSAGSSMFSAAQLKNLFMLQEDTASDTLDTLNIKALPSSQQPYHHGHCEEDLTTWDVFKGKSLMGDPILYSANEAAGNVVSTAMHCLVQLLPEEDANADKDSSEPVRKRNRSDLPCGDWTVAFQRPPSPRYSEAGSPRPPPSDRAGVNFNIGDSRSDIASPRSQRSDSHVNAVPLVSTNDEVIAAAAKIDQVRGVIAGRRRRKNVVGRKHDESAGRVYSIAIGDKIDLRAIASRWEMLTGGKAANPKKLPAAASSPSNMTEDLEAIVLELDVLDPEVIHMKTFDWLDCFLFDFGCIVFWGLTSEEGRKLLHVLRPYVKKPAVETFDDYMVYTPACARTEETDEERHQSTIVNDDIHLSTDGVYERLAYSYAFGQSVKLDLFEWSIDRTIQGTRNIPENLARTGKIGIGITEVTKKMGELFVQRSNINLHSDILDTPDVFWEFDLIERVYEMCRDYLDVRKRLDVLNQKLDIMKDMYEMIQNELNVEHGNKLEVIVIVLIILEVVLECPFGDINYDVLHPYYFNPSAKAGKVDERLLGIRLLTWEYARPFQLTVSKSITFQPWEPCGQFNGQGLNDDSLAVWLKDSQQLVSRKLPAEDTLLGEISTDMSVTCVLHHKGIIYYKVKEDSLIRRWSSTLNTELSAISIGAHGTLLAYGDYIFHITNRECEFLNTGIHSESIEWQTWFEVRPLHDDPMPHLLARLFNQTWQPPTERVESPHSVDIIVSSESWQCGYIFYSNRSIVYLRINYTSYSFPSGEPLLDCCLVPHHVGLIGATFCGYGLGVCIIDVLSRCTLYKSDVFPGYCSDWIHVLQSGHIVFEFDEIDDEEDHTTLGTIPPIWT
ncbi:DNA repair and recombination protein RAD54-like [Perkinsus chesapeaki]|uniref:DNA repair and recombination protein RAD54-like n=1 Tax=Perkinsus chesapeaki TaxID=330153 RepID=A0A7J6LRF7_PERCH|nr:DNA repair and recombination protein RAD54-like [Perkinsus chesapeaki]